VRAVGCRGRWGKGASAAFTHVQPTGRKDGLRVQLALCFSRCDDDVHAGLRLSQLARCAAPGGLQRHSSALSCDGMVGEVKTHSLNRQKAHESRHGTTDRRIVKSAIYDHLSMLQDKLSPSTLHSSFSPTVSSGVPALRIFSLISIGARVDHDDSPGSSGFLTVGRSCLQSWLDIQGFLTQPPYDLA
jgi:hypothetical protein